MSNIFQNQTKGRIFINNFPVLADWGNDYQRGLSKIFASKIYISQPEVLNQLITTTKKI